MVTRNTRGQFAKTAINQTIDDVYEGFDYESLAARYPTAGVIVNLATSAFGVYSGLQVAGYIAFAALLMTGSAFIAFIVGLFSAVVAIVYSLRAGAMAGRWIATGQFEYDYQRAKSTVLGWFKKDEVQHV